MKKLLSLGTYLILIIAVLTATFYFFATIKNSYAEGSRTIAIVGRPLVEKKCKVAIPISYGDLITISKDKMFFVDRKGTIRIVTIVPIKSDTMFAEEVLVINRGH